MVTIELDKDYAKRAIEQAIGSLKRQLTKTFNPAMKQIIEQDIAIYQTGLNTMKAK